MIDWNGFTWRGAADNMDRLQSSIGCLETFVLRMYRVSRISCAIEFNVNQWSQTVSDLIGRYILATRLLSFALIAVQPKN